MDPSTESFANYAELADAEMGKVVVRFPPEASGYLHIGHAKAALLNQMYALRYNGKLLLRFDDTNCDKEKTEFEHIIMEDLALLGIKHDSLSYTSDHFELIMRYAEQMLRLGQAFCDDTDGATMKEERLNRIASKHRNNSVETNMEMWQGMTQGTEQGLRTCLRAKMSISSDNGCMRDPVMYRCNLTPHPRLGDTYKVYPTYDFACPIVDSTEGVTHALRTTEYLDREAQFYWFIDTLHLRKPKVWDYSRLNMVHTVMSKRKLAWFVEENHVSGWDDPRFPTVRGIIRRGMAVEALKEFIWSQGASRNTNYMEWDKIWAINKRVLDPRAPRYTALHRPTMVPVHLNTTGPVEIRDIPVHKKNPSLGTRNVAFGTSRVYIECEDAELIGPSEEVTLMDWGNIIVTNITYQSTESTESKRRIVSMEAVLNLQGDFKKTKKKLTWLAESQELLPLTKFRATTYDYLVTKARIEDDDDITSLVNPQSKADYDMIGDAGLKLLKKGAVVQLQRRAFYICDQEYDPSSDTSLVLIQIPDGKQALPPANTATPKVHAKVHAKVQATPPADGLTKQERVRLEKARKAAEKAAAKTAKKKDASPPAIVSAPGKKQTKLGMGSTKEANFSEWYSEVIVKAELIEYYDVSGCYILRPASYAIWEVLKDFLDKSFKAAGVENCYFPLFVSNKALEREKEHIADFAPEVAWVTRSGDTDLAEPIAIRPTSETVMYPAFAKWIQSHRDLPLRLNQWNNVVRWEFKHPQPFIRTREFLWQEGHNAFGSPEELAQDVAMHLESYRAAYEDILAVPVVRGRKSDKEKFAGGDYTLTVEAFVPTSGRGIQAATSHYLGQNFSKMFDIAIEDPKSPNSTLHVWQSSFGFTTRSIGVMIMVHGDDKGLVLPPKVATVQVVLVPCGITNKVSEQDKASLYTSMRAIKDQLASASVRCYFDDRDHVNVGWKFNHWELKGVPIRLEVGLRDLQNATCTLVRRDNADKIDAAIGDSLPSKVSSLLDTIQAEMLQRATAKRDQCLAVTDTISDFLLELDSLKMCLVPWCKETECEDQIKLKSTRSTGDTDAQAPAMGAKSLCIPLDQSRDFSNKTCIICSKPAQCHGLFGRSY